MDFPAVWIILPNVMPVCQSPKNSARLSELLQEQRENISSVFLIFSPVAGWYQFFLPF